MKINKHKNASQIKKKATKSHIRKVRRLAAKCKIKADKHRRKYKQHKASKGFLAIVGAYINKTLQIEQDFQGQAFAKKGNSTYSTGKMIKSILLLNIMGLKRVYHAKDYQDEHVLARTIELEKFPSDTTIYRFLNRFHTLTFCKRIQRVNRDKITKKLKSAEQIVCDGDTSTIQTYSNHKQGSCKGYNKKCPGGFCLQSLQYFVNGMSVLPEILPGNKVPHKAFSTYNDLKAVRKLCGRLDWIRLDSGFVGREMLDFLDDFSYQGNSEKKVKYIVNTGMGCIGAKKAKRLSRFREWISISKGVKLQDHGVCQIFRGDKKVRRLLLIKSYFSGGKGKGEWKYYALCSSENSTPATVLYHFYLQRQTIENFFDEAKNDYYIEHLPCKKLMGNNLYINLLCLAFNILYLFRKTALRKQDQKFRLSTFQRKYASLQMEFDGKTIYIFRSSSLYYRRFIAILRHLEKLEIFLEYRIC